MAISSSLRLKQPAGWFAAGREVAEALGLLPDGPFKLFMWICLNADRGLGAIRIELHTIARALNKTPAEVHAHLEDLLQTRIGQMTADGDIQIADRFWPYERTSICAPDQKFATYISQVKRAFLDRRCVRSCFTAADDKIAAELYHAGVPITDVEHAILLGSLRKYVALINNGRGTPITSLRYFSALFDEVKQDISQGYWIHVARRVKQVEQQWSGFETSATTTDEIKVTK